MRIIQSALAGRRASTPARFRRQRTRVATFPGAEQGQSLVELAVCLPILLLVVTGIFTFGIAMNSFLMLTDATNVGARLLAISRGQTTAPARPRRTPSTPPLRPLSPLASSSASSSTEPPTPEPPAAARATPPALPPTLPRAASSRSPSPTPAT